jgi:hypothetical protein
VVDAPEELRPGPGNRTCGDLLEASEQIAVTAAREANEVVRARVHLLEKGRLRIDEPVGAQNPSDLADGPLGLDEVLEHRLDDHGVDALVGERKLVRIGDELREWADVDVEPDGAEPPIRIESLDPVPHGAAPDYEQGRGLLESREQEIDIPRRNGVEWLPTRSQPVGKALEGPGVSGRRLACPTCEILLPEDAVLEIDENGDPAHSWKRSWSTQGASR